MRLRHAGREGAERSFHWRAGPGSLGAVPPPAHLVDTPFLTGGYIEIDRSGQIVRLNRNVLERYGMPPAKVEAFLAAPPAEWQARIGKIPVTVA